jgi:hypothetical protein
MNTSPTLTSSSPDFAAPIAAVYPPGAGNTAILPAIVPKSRPVVNKYQVDRTFQKFMVPTHL